MKIIHLRNKAIDRERWDKCICMSHNHLTYAYSWYLDIVSPNWEALVTHDYEYIMPLPMKRRYKIPYLVQPILTQQLGIFSTLKITEDIVDEFVKQIPYFSYELNLNSANFSTKVVSLPNYLLNLHHPYQQLTKHFSKNTQRNLEKAKKQNLSIRKDIKIQDFIDLYQSVDRNFDSIKQNLLEKIIEAATERNALHIYGIYNDNNHIVAGLCLLNTCNRLIYLLPVSNEEGKNTSAMFLLIDHIIRQEAGKNTILDFEGSKIEGVARFYKGFGAKNHPYFILKRMRPSFLIGK